MTVPPFNSRQPGFIGSVKTLTGTVLELMHVRVELFALEWQEERERVKQVIVLAVAGVVLLALGLLLATFFIVVTFWDTYRLTAIAVVTIAYLGGGAICLWGVRGQLKNHPPPFANSLREFIEDLRQLKAEDEPPAPAMPARESPERTL